MLKITPQSLLQFDPIQDFSPLDDDAGPATWSGNWVSRRLVEGFKTLRLIPLKGMPAGLGMHGLPTWSNEKTYWHSRSKGI